MAKTLVALLFGGRSGEHEVSRNSAYNVALALRKKYNVFPIGISKEGEWYGPIPTERIKDFTPDGFAERKITILPNPQSKGKIYSLPDLEPIVEADVFFPVLHGTYGEDGTIQGLLKLAGIPFVGAGVLASAAGMDKILMKKIFAQTGLPQVPFLSFFRKAIETDTEGVAAQIEEELGYPVFIKPANLGSSVGVTKAANRKELLTALNLAARYDRRIIAEKGINAREIEVSVLGNDDPTVSLPGEIIPCNEFYDYKAKYIDDRSVLIIPAEIPAEQIRTIQEIAVKAYKSLVCSGLARIDFFIDKDTDDILINEINTMPGFTSISMYPKLWEYSGLPAEELVDRLIQLAFELYEEEKKNVTNYDE